MSSRTTILFSGLLVILCLAFMAPAPTYAIKYEVVVFDPNWQPPAGAYSGGRAQATAAILDHIQSNFAFAGTTIQVGSQAPASTGANDKVNTVKFLPSNSTSYFSHRGDADWQTAAWGVTYGNDEHYVFGSNFNNNPALNNSSAYTRAAAGTAAHELAHGLNATHTTVMTNKMCAKASGAAKAATDRAFTPGNQARMLKAANVGGAKPGTKGKESLTVVYSHLPGETIDPDVIHEEKWYVNVTGEVFSLDYEFGYLNTVGNFIGLHDIDSFFDVQLFGGVEYEFALRSRIDVAEIYPISTSGEAMPVGMAFPPEQAVAPPMSPMDGLYFQQADLIFNTMMGPVNVMLTAEGTNGFFKAPQNEIPVLQDWGMILLVLILLGFAAYRIRTRMKKAVA